MIRVSGVHPLDESVFDVFAEKGFVALIAIEVFFLRCAHKNLQRHLNNCISFAIMHEIQLKSVSGFIPILGKLRDID